MVRQLRIIFACAVCMLLLVGAWPNTGKKYPSVAAAYVGPANVVSSAVSWWGLRAYSAALASGGASTTPVLDVFGTTTSTGCTVYLLGNGTGGLDLLTAGAGGVGHQCLLGVTHFCTVTNTTCTVSKLYDQVGTNHLIQATAASQPPFSLTGGVSSFPMIGFTGAVASGTYLSIASFSTTITQPFTASHVINQTDGTNRDFFRPTVSRSILGYGQGGADTYTPYAGSFLSFSISANTYYAIQTAFNGASSAVMINGTDNTSQNPGATDMIDSGDTVNMNDPPQSTALPFNFEELGLWASQFSNTQRTNMNGNQRAYWSF